jgi:formate hydrogenlyase subunit 3/multisubunit Na+/H+ antiporter MnhD subunit
MIGNPLLPVVLPLAAGPLLYLLRRWRAMTLLAAAIAFSCAVLSLQVSPERSVTLLGRGLALDPILQAVLALLFASAGFSFLAAWRVPQGRSFPSLGLLVLGLLAVAMLLRQLAFVALLVEIGAVVAVFILQGGRRGSTRGALRFLVMVTLALPFLLIASWRIDLYVINADNAIYLGQATLFLGAGLLLWFAVVPFHGWIPAIAAEAPPGVVAFTCNAFLLVALGTLAQLLQTQSWLAENQDVFRALFLGGLATAAFGGVVAALRRNLSTLLGYAALSSLGVALFALGTESQLGALAAGLEVVNRTIALTLTAAAVASFRRYAPGDGFDQLRGVARRMPLTTFGLFVGGMSLAGVPLSGGFAARWLLLRTLTVRDAWPIAILLLAGAGVAFGYVRALRALLGDRPIKFQIPNAKPEVSSHTNNSQVAGIRREPLIATTLIVIMTIICLAVGLYPQFVLPILQKVVDGLTFLSA